MQPSELTAKVVREELEHLINRYPDRNGNVLEYPEADPDETTCVYFADTENHPISFPSYSYSTEELENVKLKVPVCIVGQWIDDFHPEFKSDDAVRDVLLRNTTMRYAAIPFDPDVKVLLIRAQDQQDTGRLWCEIDLNKVDVYTGY